MNRSQDEKRIEFLNLVKIYLTEDPSATPYLFQVADSAIQTVLKNQRQICADLESSLLAIAAKKFKGSKALAIEKIEKNKENLCLNWDWLLKELRDKK